MYFWSVSRVSQIFILGLLLLAPTPALTQKVAIELHETPSDQDDYLCWSPVKARAKLISPATAPLIVTLKSVGVANGGEVKFQANFGTRPTALTYQPMPSLDLAIPGDGSWATFWVMATRASIGSKDVRIVALENSGTEAGSLPVMVRIRKNAEKLSAQEISQFLTALAQLHDLANQASASKFAKYVTAHSDAFSMGIHGAPSGLPLFLAWHRAFLLSLERELQAIDGRVALPYWRFDQAAPKIFSPEFLGVVSGGSNLVQFSSTNPLLGWRMSAGAGLVRANNHSSSGPIPADRLATLFGDSFNNTYQAISGAIELSYHNSAHSQTGGWLNSASSPRDPLFFLLHANVDRAWAQWQVQFKKLDAETNDPTVYSALGTYPGSVSPSRFRKGSYAKDVMWPWSGIGGDQGTPDTMDDWPSVAFLLPSGPAGAAPPISPASQIDYLDTNGRGLAHHACYDDMDFLGRPL